MQKSALLAYALSRALFFVVVLIVANTAWGEKVFGTIWQTRIVLQRERIAPTLIGTVMNGDVWYYRSIARDGYERRPFAPAPPANWAFFPLFPLLVRALRAIGDYAFSGMLIAHAALLGAFLLFPRVAVDSGAGADDAQRAVWYLAFFPTSYFLSLPLPESLFLFLTLLAFFGAQRERWWLAGLAGALAAVTRAQGILLFPALLVLALERKTWRRWPILWLLLIPAALGGFMLHLYRLTGNALAFAALQGAWRRHPAPFWEPLAAYFRAPATLGEPWNFIALNFAAAVLVFGVALFFLLRRQFALATYAALSMIVPLSSGSLQSVARYAVVVFPLFIALGVAGRHAAVDRLIFAVSVAFFAFLVTLLALHVDFAIA